MKSIITLVIVLLLFSCNTTVEQKETVAAENTAPQTEIDSNYDPEAKLKELGIELPTPSAPIANFVNSVRTGNLVFLSGQGPLKANGENITGVVGQDLTIEEGYEAARVTGINQLAALKAQLGNLNKVKRIVKVLGMVNAATDFTEQPKVVNGYSDLMVEVFGEKGKHARAAVGMGSLPGNIAVEVEMIVEVYDQ